jgi:hypothetical protein
VWYLATKSSGSLFTGLIIVSLQQHVDGPLLSLAFPFSSGYDFGYLLKLLTNAELPSEESEFFELLKIYFPNIYDVKYLMKSCKNLKGGLQEVSEQLEVIASLSQFSAV